VAGCRAKVSHLLICCDANAQHTTWESSNINNRDESLFNFIMANNLDIMIKGNRPTFCNRPSSKLLAQALIQEIYVVL
jgi:hypothetical protein